MKKLDIEESDADGEPLGSSSARPERSAGNNRKGVSHTSSKRKKSKARRKGSTHGGIHQRGDKRVMR